MYRIEFTVTGNGNFPIDMLRYDSCFPYNSEDVAKIECRVFSDTRQTIRLAKYALKRDTMPTTLRWQSFLWSVSDIKTFKV